MTPSRRLSCSCESTEGLPHPLTHPANAFNSGLPMRRCSTSSARGSLSLPELRPSALLTSALDTQFIKQMFYISQDPSPSLKCLTYKRVVRARAAL